jgi:HSP20 family protein
MPKRVQRVMAVILPGGSRGAEVEWRPRADAYRLPTGWILKFDLAGVRLEDVEVRVQGCRITVAGTRRDCFLEEGGHHYFMEISYNRFERTIDLPCDLENPEVGLEFRDGILLVRVKTQR